MVFSTSYSLHHILHDELKEGSKFLLQGKQKCNILILSSYTMKKVIIITPLLKVSPDPGDAVRKFN